MSQNYRGTGGWGELFRLSHVLDSAGSQSRGNGCGTHIPLSRFLSLFHRVFFFLGPEGSKCVSGVGMCMMQLGND